MTLPLETEVRIRQLHFAEHWPVGTIAAQLGVHDDAVRRVLGLLSPRTRSIAAPRPQLVDPYRAFIAETLATYPRLRATRLFDMARARGYAGSVRTLREHVAVVRPKPRREVYLRLDTLPGEQAQIDWAHVGKVRVDGGERALWLFVMVLSWSRAMWAEFVFDLTAHSLLRSLSRAAEFFGGSTRQWLFDNARTVVLARHGDAVRFHPLLLELSGHYRAQLRLCTVRKANQKGKVERAIRYLRDRFLGGRNIRDVEHGNRELLTFLAEVANPRPHPKIAERTVAECLAEERARLLPLPDPRPSTDLIVPVEIDRTAFARFDNNVYSVPSEHAEHVLTLVADDAEVRFLTSGTEVARHRRSWGRRQQIEDPAHRTALLAAKRGAQEAKGRDRLRAAVPRIDALYERWVDAGRNLGSMTARTIRLLDLYGDGVVASAIDEVLATTIHDPGAIGVLCERRRHAADRPVPIAVELGAHVPDRDVIPHDLENYDAKRRRG